MKKLTKFFENLLKPFARRPNGELNKKDLKAIAAREQKAFRYETLAAATSNFSPKNKLGEGGFGPVYKLGDGRLVAVKRLGRGSRQGGKEFTNEAKLLSQLQHKNVVNLYGYCAHAEDKLLVYEYVANESLDKLLFSGEGSEFLHWERRFEVIVGVAKGLLYLHEDAHTPIIHRDIKASNILLDGRWNPKIADFGMARLFPDELAHVQTRVAGTNGYMAPEYFMSGTLSPKVDVFSFGVLVIEIVSGQKNSRFSPRHDAATLLELAWMLYTRKETMDMLDPALRSTADAAQVAMCVHIGLLCTQANPKLRPDMRRVVVLLSKKPSTLKEPIKPGTPYFKPKGISHGLRNPSYTTGESSGVSSFASNIALEPNLNNTATTSSPYSATTMTRTATATNTTTSRSLVLNTI
ncbi:putative serine/threonine-protein kinase isoform X2 [Phalaenopsis equestris]|uniref:putative serine/threonine-protein kinase isoform X2 n=1 Tax=Phalaenopsis equestris TaxID=78828 RepID=UPI0009E53922|nr:putative serine/threonine-protein kinase isoform X2 [Phalaenopsis equestris]